MFKSIECNNLSEIQNFLKNEILSEFDLEDPKHPVMCWLVRQDRLDLVEKVNSNPYISELLTDLNISDYILDYGIMCVPPQKGIPAHIDGNDPVNQLGHYVNPWRVLIPISGAENTVTKFFESSKPPIRKTAQRADGAREVYDEFDPKYLTLTEEHSSEGVYMIDTSKVHSADNPTDNYRIHFWICSKDDAPLP